MILQELVNYYNRKAADPDSGIAPLGWERKEIPFLIVINEDGGFVGVEDTREMVGKKKVAKTFLVPMGVKRSVGILPNLGWDNVEYVLGFPCKGKPERVDEQHKAFVESLSRFASVRDVATALRFLGNEDGLRALRANETFAEALDSCSFVTFRIAGGSNTIVASNDFIEAYDAEIHKESTQPSLCLVSGVEDEIAVLHPAIKGVAGTNTTGGNVVSFNFSAACSFGKDQGCNAPIGGRAAFAYATALNTLLGKDSRQKLHVGDATVVFWAEKDDSFESAFSSLFEEPPKDNPDALVDSVRALYKSPQTGVCVLDDDKTRFFVLGLAPNSARISVRFWETGTVAELSARFRQYFDDLMVVHGPKDRDHLSLWRLLVSTAQQGKSENVNPNLAGAFMRTVLEGRPFPETLIQAVLVRVRAERDVGYQRSKLIKGYLCRKFNLTTEERNKLVSLNKDNMNIGYRLGRLFAALEKIQNDANPGINATIRDRFYAAASSSPVTVFGNLMRMSNHWLSKVEGEKPGLAVVRKKLLGEIMEGLSSFPAHLVIADQGFFALGYYHQQQDFFTKKQSDESEQN